MKDRNIHRFRSTYTGKESRELNVESDKMDISAENLRETTSKILSKSICKKQQINISKRQRKALKLTH